MASAGRRPTVLLQIALFVVVTAVIINSSVCLAAGGHDGTGTVVIGQSTILNYCPGTGSGSNDPNHPVFPSPPGKPYTGRGCRTVYGCRPPAGGQP
ncbi:protein WIR1A-like [Hordeum vulgare subsp. vulgare]|uniref:protein WIR1A-like n=1 Tax=Hordeum vulgare subsp. vulgare TaxID=112509 RepID=UPI001D1A53FC|nr:protein WIR1A-like [Hordeum vulgare subsp. vulgare]